MYNEEKEVLNYIKTEYSEIYLEKPQLPEPYRGTGEIKAIVLGCDPSNKVCIENEDKYLHTVFALSDEDMKDNKESKNYFSSIENNLKAIGLEKENIYVQNLCRNYFKQTTSKLPEKAWTDCAIKWVNILKEELDKEFDKSIPVLITAEIIINPLCKDHYKKSSKPQDYYYQPIFIQPNENYLDRELIMLFRHMKYNLEEKTLLSKCETHIQKLIKYRDEVKEKLKR